MRRLYAEGAIQLIAEGSGFVFAAKQVQEDKIIVSYKMFSLSVGTMAPVTRSVFMSAKFGEGYKKFEKSKGDFLSCRTIILPDSNMLVIFPTGAAAIFDKDEPVWHGDILHRHNGPADAVIHEGSLWVSFPVSGAIVRFSLRNMKEELRIGGGQDGYFGNPQGLWLEGDNLKVCDAGLQKIVDVNLKSYVVGDYAEFDEPVRQYLKIGGNEVVLLDSGIYKL